MINGYVAGLQRVRQTWTPAVSVSCARALYHSRSEFSHGQLGRG